MDILPCAALSGKEHGRTSWSNCNTADTHHNEEIPRKGCLDRYPLLLKLEKIKACLIHVHIMVVLIIIISNL